MPTLDPNAEQAIPHEAGHVLVSMAVGVPARGLDIEVVRLPNNQGIRVGNFATLSYDPVDDEVPTLQPKIRAALLLIIAGGIAGQIFDRIKMSGDGANDVRRRFDRLKSPNSTETIESVAKRSQGIFLRHKLHFWKIVVPLRRRYSERIINNREIQTLRHNLATDQDFDAIFGDKPQPK